MIPFGLAKKGDKFYRGNNPTVRYVKTEEIMTFSMFHDDESANAVCYEDLTANPQHGLVFQFNDDELITLID